MTQSISLDRAKRFTQLVLAVIALIGVLAGGVKVVDAAGDRIRSVEQSVEAVQERVSAKVDRSDLRQMLEPIAEDVRTIKKALIEQGVSHD